MRQERQANNNRRKKYGVRVQDHLQPLHRLSGANNGEVNDTPAGKQNPAPRPLNSTAVSTKKNTKSHQPPKYRGNAPQYQALPARIDGLLTGNEVAGPSRTRTPRHPLSPWTALSRPLPGRRRDQPTLTVPLPPRLEGTSEQLEPLKKRDAEKRYGGTRSGESRKTRNATKYEARGKGGCGKRSEVTWTGG